MCWNPVILGSFRCARISLVCLVDESSTMLIARSTCSEAGGGRSNPVRRSPANQIPEPQRKQIRFGLVKPNLFAANLPKRVKPVSVPEAMSVCKGRADRGAREQRGEKDKPRNLGDPLGRVKTQPFSRMHKALGARWEVGHVHSSKEESNDLRAKGRDRGSATDQTGRPAWWISPTTEQALFAKAEAGSKGEAAISSRNRRPK